MRDIIKPAIVLLIITTVAAACLGIVYAVTKEPIKQQEEKLKNEAMAKILPSASDFEPVDVPLSGDIMNVNAGLNNGSLEGYAIDVKTNRGYAGEISLMVGISKDGLITGINIVNHAETPGLGANAAKPSFTGLYIGKSGTLSVTKSPNPSEQEIQAITSATITSDAVTDAVNNALLFFEQNLSEGDA